MSSSRADANHGIPPSGTRALPSGERILVGISPSPSSVHLLGAAQRLAETARSPWIALYVETPASLHLGAAARDRVTETLRLAQRLGAETATILGERAAVEVVRYARSHNVTRIVVGKPTHAIWRDWLRRPFLEEVVRSSTGIDVYVVSGDASAPSPKPDNPLLVPPASVGAYAASAIVVAVSTAGAWLTFGRDRLADTVMVHLLGIIVVAMRFGYGPSVVAAVFSVLAIDFFFVPPYFSFAVSDFQHVVTFGVMFLVAVVISGLAQRIREQARAAALREQRTASLYGLTRDLAGTRAIQELATVAVGHLHDVFDARVGLYLAPENGTPQEAERGDGPRGASLAAGDPALVAEEKERVALEWVLRHGEAAGHSTDTLPATKAIYVPLRETRTTLGALAILPADAERFTDPEQRALLDVFAAQIASALERARLADDAHRTRLQIEAERLRSALLSSISHDLRTPLAVITGAASTLVDPAPTLTREARRDLTETIHEEAERLNRLVHNLLEMTRIVAGAIKVTKEWQPLEEIVGAALNRTEATLRLHPIEVRLPADLPLVPIDGVLIEQVLINLLENAAKYAPKGSPLMLSASREGEAVVVEVADRGPGIPPDQRERIFEKFYRLPGEREGGGAGLGLAICRGIVAVHGGHIWVEARDGGGASFRFTIPIEGAPPPMIPEETR